MNSLPFFSFPLIICFAVTIHTTEAFRVELALRWHLQICNIMRQISPVTILLQPVSSLAAFDWLNISGNYFSNDFSFSLLSSCRIFRSARWHFYYYGCAHAGERREEGHPSVSFTSNQEEGRKKTSSFDLIFECMCGHFPFCYWIWNIATGFKLLFF